MTRVPGTFKSKPTRPIRDRSTQGAFAEGLLLDIGALAAERWLLGECSIMAAREPFGGGCRWHITVAHPLRYPTWDEIKTAVYSIPSIELPAGRTFAQLLGDPGHSTWVDVHENCFHLYEIDDPWPVDG